MSIIAYHNRIICYPHGAFSPRTYTKSPAYQAYRGCLLLSHYNEYGRLKEAVDHYFFNDGGEMKPDFSTISFYDASSGSFKKDSNDDVYQLDGWILNSTGNIWEAYTYAEALNNVPQMKIFLFDRVSSGFGTLSLNGQMPIPSRKIFADRFMAIDATQEDDRVGEFVAAIAVHWPGIYSGYVFDITSMAAALHEDRVCAEDFISLRQFAPSGSEKIDVNKGFGPPKETKPARSVKQTSARLTREKIRQKVSLASQNA